MFFSIPPDFFDKDSSSSVDDQQMLVDNDTETSTRVPSTAVSDEAALPAGIYYLNYLLNLRFVAFFEISFNFVKKRIKCLKAFKLLHECYFIRS